MPQNLFTRGLLGENDLETLKNLLAIIQQDTPPKGA